jgi:hypothetical protein
MRAEQTAMTEMKRDFIVMKKAEACCGGETGLGGCFKLLRIDEESHVH